MSSRSDSHEPVELPPYRALFVVDMKDFSGTPGRRHAELTEEIPRILRDAFRRANLAALLDDVRFEGTTGDGYVLGFNATKLPYLIKPLLPELQNELAWRNRAGRPGQAAEVMRMRVSISVGPLTDSGENTISDGSGNTRIETHRLLDSQPVRDLLTRSTDGTCVAAIVSARAYEDAVLSEYAADDSAFYVEAPVQVKTYEGTAYLRVPSPTGDLLKHGFRTPDDPTETSDEAPERRPRTSGPSHNTLVHGRNDGVGSIAGSVGTFFSGDVSGPIHSGKGDQYNAPAQRRRRREERGDA